MSGLTENRIILSLAKRLMLVAATLVVGFASHNSFAQSGYQDSESFRADLLTMLELERAILQDIDGGSATDEPIFALIENAIINSSALSSQELTTLQRINFSLAPSIGQLRSLKSAMKFSTDQSKLDSTAVQEAVSHCIDGYVEADGEFEDPPGPCGLVNFLPDQILTGADMVPVEMTENDYPIVIIPLPVPPLICRKYQKPAVVMASRITANALEVVSTVAKRFCDTIGTVGGVGANFAAVCIVSDLAFLFVKQIRENISTCHSYRIASEGTSTYVRAGELFVQSRQNTKTIDKRAAEGFRDAKNGLIEIEDQVEENSRKIEQTIAAIEEVLEELRIENARLAD